MEHHDASAVHVAVSYSLTPGEYLRGLKTVIAHTARRDRNRRWASAVTIVGGSLHFLILCVAALMFGGAGGPWLVVVLPLIVVQFLVEFIARRLLQGSIGISYDPRRHCEVTVSIAEDGLICQSRLHRESWCWAGIVRVYSPEGLIVIELVGLEMIAIPTRAFGSSDESELFRSTVLRRSQAETP